MKKVLLSVLAVGMLTACSQDETVDMQAPSQIAFAGAFVDNVTRAAVDPSITTDGENALTAFSVWGYVKNNAGTLGEVFDAVEVNKVDEAWTYSPLQYWVANNQYNFFALATNKDKEYIAKEKLDENALAENGLGEISFTNVDGSEDLLYATATATTGPSITTAPAPVKFVFDHLLSKVKFTFKNGFATTYSTIKVTDITMEVPSVGTINLKKQGEYSWDTEGADPLTLDFDNIEKGVAIAEGAKGESDKERLTIPAAATQEYIVTFNVELLQDGATVLPPTPHTVKISNYELKPGFAYNFVATLTPDNVAGGLKPIEFEAEVEDWVETGDQGIEGVKNVSTPEELAAALKEGGSVKLMAHMNLTEALNITKDADLHLNGFDIIAASSDAIVVNNGAKFTVNGEGDVKAATDDNSSANALWLIHGTAYINGGNWYVGADGADRNDCIYVGRDANKNNAADYESHLIITGGTFEAKVFEQGQYWVLNIQDEHCAAGSTITVYGGTYKNFDPANNKSENPVVSFVPAGYESVDNGDGTFTVKAK